MSREGITSLSSGEGGLGEEGGGAGLLDPAEACYLVASGWWSAVTVGGGAPSVVRGRGHLWVLWMTPEGLYASWWVLGACRFQGGSDKK